MRPCGVCGVTWNPWPGFGGNLTNTWVDCQLADGRPVCHGCADSFRAGEADPPPGFPADRLDRALAFDPNIRPREAPAIEPEPDDDQGGDFYEQTEIGEQAVIRGAELRSLPARPLRSRRHQAADLGPLFSGPDRSGDQLTIGEEA